MAMDDNGPKEEPEKETLEVSDGDFSSEEENV
jgi:hypothetical protein